MKVHEGLLPGLIHAHQGGTYRFVDESAAPRSSQTYLLEEVEVGGRPAAFGPFTGQAVLGPARGAAAVETFEREPHPGARGLRPPRTLSARLRQAVERGGGRPTAST